MENQPVQPRGGWRRLLAAILVMTGSAVAARGAADPANGPVVQAVSRVLDGLQAARGQAGAEPVREGAAAAPEECAAVHRYFPLHEGDSRQYAGNGRQVTVSTRTAWVGGRQAFALNAGGAEDYLAYSDNQILLLGEAVPGALSIIFDHPVVWLDESMLLHGGSRTSHTGAWVLGYHFQMTLTVDVSLAADAVVGAGTFGNCRLLNLTVVASLEGYGSETSQERMQLAPGVGLCRLTPVDMLEQWVGLTGGTVGGVPVAQLAAPSLLASPSLVRSPGPVTVVEGSTVVLEAAATGAMPLRYQWRRNGVALAGATNAVLTMAAVAPADAGTYELDVRNDVGCVASAGAALTVLPDRARPAVTFLSPRPNTRTTNATGTVRIRATDDRGVREVYCQRDGGDWVAATPGEADWEVPMTWAAGTNRLRAYAVDMTGKTSVTQSMALVFVVSWPVDLAVSGEGRLSPDLRGAFLEVGRGYALTAVPAAGWLFSNWVGTATSGQARLSFLMQSNLVLRANFVPNPFRALKGSYAGLFYDPDAPAHENAGLLALAVAESGAFSGRLTQGRSVTPFSGRFDLALTASNRVVRPGREPWEVRLRLVAGTDRVEGTVAGGGWTASSLGYRGQFHAVTNPATGWAGRYTAMLASETEEEVGLGGAPGVATLSVSAAGRVQWSGALADGTPAVQAAGLGSPGWWPLYVSLYGGRGSVFGWMTLTPGDEGGSDVGALEGLRWTKPGGVGGGSFAGGLTNELGVVGSRYEAPRPGVPVLPLTNGVLLLAGGDLPLALTNGMAVDGRSRFVFSPPNPQGMALSLVPATGAVGGSFLHPATGARAAIRSVVLQRQGVGAGFFRGPVQPGVVAFGPVGP